MKKIELILYLYNKKFYLFIYNSIFNKNSNFSYNIKFF